MAVAPSGKTVCPTCGATSKTPGFGQDGVKRVLKQAQPLSNDSEHVKRRNRSRAINAQNRVRQIGAF